MRGKCSADRLDPTAKLLGMMPAVLRVALPVPLPTLFDYLPPAKPTVIAPGCRVLVPFGRGQQVGVVVALAAESTVPANKLKPALRLLDDLITLGAS